MVNLNVHLYLTGEQALVYVCGLRTQALVTLLAFRIGARMSSSRMWVSRGITALAQSLHERLLFKIFCKAMARRTWST